MGEQLLLLLLLHIPGIAFALRLTDWQLRHRRQAPRGAQDALDDLRQVLLGESISFECGVEAADVSGVDALWYKDGKNVTAVENKIWAEVSKGSKGVMTSELQINNISWSDAGAYQCKAWHSGASLLKEGNKIQLSVHSMPKIIGKQNGAGRVEEWLEMWCMLEGYPLPNLTWLYQGNLLTENQLKYEITEDHTSERTVKSLLKILNLSHEDNGTYLCHGQNAHNSKTAILEALVYDVPSVRIEHVVAVSSSKLFLNWTVENWNQPITSYSLSYREEGDNSWRFFQASEVSNDSTSYLMSNLSASTNYHIRLAAENPVGQGEYFVYKTAVRTLAADPEFTPEISIKGITKNAISVGWTDPPETVAPFIHFYKVTKRLGDTVSEVIHSQPFPIHLWDGLAPATEYLFTVSACNRYSGECSPASQLMPGSTYDGVAGPPAEVTLNCRSDNVSAMNWVDVKWQPPAVPNGRLEFYTVELTGRARFLDENRKPTVISTSPQTKTEDAFVAAAAATAPNSATALLTTTKTSLVTRFDFLEPNTNYSVRVCAVTGSKECGEWRSAACNMGPRPPPDADLAKFSWTTASAEESVAAVMTSLPDGKPLEQQPSPGPVFKLTIPRLSSRNGPICCFRVVVVKLPSTGMHTVAPLPLPGSMPLSSYAAVHANTDATGAYIAEIVSAIYMGREVIIGDGKNTAALGLGSCYECLPPTSSVAALTETISGPASREKVQKRFTGIDNSADIENSHHHQQRHHHHEALSDAKAVEDGRLDPTANYTAFVEIIIENTAGGGSRSSHSVIGRSPLMVARKNPASVIDSRKLEMNTVLVSVLGVLAGLVLVALLLLALLFTLRRYSKQVASQQGVEMMDLKHTFRHFCSTLRRGGGNGGVGGHAAQFLLTQDNFGSAPPDLPPIERGAMVAAYLERHKDSDYGFQAEFEALPEACSDRTTSACDLPCNRPKNRYPDIKSYDQTRVRLSAIDGVEGSDYINANFVVGYKERKRWICAQGPLISTLEDFWRMIHEQGVELIIMLTNLEEYSRIKCAQYWPGAGQSTFGQLRVSFVQERRYSDFVVRELKVTHGEGGKPRQIFHYHYLQWKDFNAPEHAPAMLKFVKRINEAWSGSSPILVHCSAGVGRSGTLIAIDSLTQALDEEGSVSIFQTVSDLRRQRNYLVQSVKQYQFVYRAIMEYSQFGDTETSAAKLKEHWMQLVQEKGGLQTQFDKLAMVVDDRKALSVATNAENKSKNGSDSIIPYDRNRVILTPDGARPHSTYINASFIEGYHNDESFIITQDPLEETCMDFWRMVVEHNVATMVVLSTEGQFWQYWPLDQGDKVREYGYIKVTLLSRENRVAYIKREFTVYNKKTFEEVHLTHFHYTEWVEEEEAVPGSTHGLLGLVEHALAHQEQASLTGPIAVHCRFGSFRSSMYVVLSILVQQIKREGRCDVFTAVRKLRAQRQGMIQTLPQYEFVYRAIADYVDLYMNKEEEYEYSVPVGTLNNGTTKSVKSVQSAKSNGSGPYSVPVGASGTLQSSSGSSS